MRKSSKRHDLLQDALAGGTLPVASDISCRLRRCGAPGVDRSRTSAIVEGGRGSRGGKKNLRCDRLRRSFGLPDAAELSRGLRERPGWPPPGRRAARFSALALAQPRRGHLWALRRAHRSCNSRRGDATWLGERAGRERGAQHGRSRCAPSASRRWSETIAPRTESETGRGLDRAREGVAARRPAGLVAAREPATALLG
jgi:hypothetical protein